MFIFSAYMMHDVSTFGSYARLVEKYEAKCVDSCKVTADFALLTEVTAGKDNIAKQKWMVNGSVSVW